MRPHLLPFVLATLGPVPVLLWGLWTGGAALWGALLAMTFGVAALDAAAHRARRGMGAAEGAEFPAGDALSVAIALCHLPVLMSGALAVAGLTGLSPGERLGAFLAAGVWLGQVSTSNAHELIHRPGRRLFGLGRMVYVSLLFGHHVSAHRLVHHVHVATRADPNTARAGEGVYRFILRAWVGSFRAGLAAERARAARAGRRRTPYALYLAGGGATLAVAASQGGWLGGAEGAARAAAACASLGLWAAATVLVSDYVQHWGLQRRPGPDGRPEPVGPRHAWNAPEPASAALMLKAAHHSDHHAHPARPFPALQIAPDMPVLPHSLPVMGIVALVPPLWRRIMRPRLAALG